MLKTRKFIAAAIAAGTIMSVGLTGCAGNDEAQTKADEAQQTAIEAKEIAEQTAKDVAEIKEMLQSKNDNAESEGIASGEEGTSTVIDSECDFYTLDIPDDNPEGWQITYNGEWNDTGGGYFIGNSTSVAGPDGMGVFEIVVLSNNWGPQGDMFSKNLGSPSNAPDRVVYVLQGTQRRDDGTPGVQNRTEEFAQYITLK